MEKLIELLNEYCMGAFVYDNDILRFRLGDRAKIEGNAILISKSFGFIKWLVENDKIDFENQAMQYAKSDLSKFFTEWEDKNGMSDDYAMLLMLLAIQDEPINFLISILK